MAKGNLFLGTAARSVGDVVMYRREGSQVSRVRVRKIANPKTDAQCEQRAFMSAVVKFYQPLANVLDRSWQGLSRAKSYAKFLKTNAGIVRAAGYYLPKDSGFFPLPLQLSNGTLPSVPYNYDDEDKTFFITIPHVASTGTTIGDISTDLVAAGFQNGDVITVIAAVGKENDAKRYPVALQFAIDINSTDLLSTISVSGINLDLDGDVNRWKISTNGTSIRGGAVIVARNVDGVWKRSTDSLKVSYTMLESLQTPEAKAATIASYKGAAAGDNPLVYLDGDELDNA